MPIIHYTLSGSATSAATLFTTDMGDAESISVQVTSAGTSCTITYETSDDKTNWLSTTGVASTTAGSAPSATSTTAILITFPRRGRYFRARVSTYGSGTVSVVGNLHRAPAVIPSITSVTATGSGTYTVGGVAAHDAVISGSPVRTAGRALTANYTAVASGDVADMITTTVGAQIVKEYSIPENDWYAVNGITNTTTGVTVRAAQGAGIRNYVTGVQISTDTLGGPTSFEIRDGAAGTVMFRMRLQTGNGQLNFVFPTPLRGTAATLVEIATSAAVTGGVYFSVQGYSAP